MDAKYAHSQAWLLRMRRTEDDDWPAEFELSYLHRGQKIRPEMITISMTQDIPGRQPLRSVLVSGTRMDGSGRMATERWTTRRKVMPEWLAAIVAEQQKEHGMPDIPVPDGKPEEDHDD